MFKEIKLTPKQIQDTCQKIKEFSTSESYYKCWNWTGAITEDGYGKININKKYVLSHRFLCQLFYGELEDKNLVIDHLCKNKSYCNLKHLEAVTQRVNSFRSSKTVSTVLLRRTACILGHTLDDKNTKIDNKGNRTCKGCRRIIWRKTDKKNKKIRHARGLRHDLNRTHCSKGHEMTPENTYSYVGRNYRRCAVCKREGMKQYKQKKKLNRLSLGK